MAMNRIQFQPGMSLFELFRRFGTEAQCAAALEQARWPEDFRCPRCGGAAHCVLGVRARKTFQCNACHHQTSLIAGAVFEGTKLGLTVWFLAIYLISQAKTGLSALALKRDLGVSYPTAWLMHHKLMQAMVEREAGYVLCGTVQVDDAYLGGELNDGTCYRAANWQCLGETAGRGKCDRSHRAALPRKAVYVYPLAADFRAALGVAP
ncbi:MAG: IS1595 family transposase [Chromatiaceae bacterium]|jgi:transposase-like protein|nr:IS1595 family transposase [Chromatiaceae bacterium]